MRTVGSTGERVFELDRTTASRSEAVGGEAPRRRSRRAILVPQPQAEGPCHSTGLLSFQARITAGPGCAAALSPDPLDGYPDARFAATNSQFTSGQKLFRYAARSLRRSM